MAGVYWKLHHPHADRKHYRRSISCCGVKLCPGSLRDSGRWVAMERNCCSTCRHLVRRLPVSGLERGPACHPERELWICAAVSPDPKLALRMTCFISKCLGMLAKEGSVCYIHIF